MMEWARHRFRDIVSSSNSKSNYKLINYNNKQLSILVVLVLNVICLPCVVISAEVRDQRGNSNLNLTSNLDSNSNNYNSANVQRQILHSKIKATGRSDDQDHQSVSEHLEVHDHENHDKSHHEQNHPNLVVNRDDKHNEKDEDCNSTKSSHRLQHINGGESDDQNHQNHEQQHHETQRIQSILREIFLADEFGSEDDTDDQEIDSNDENLHRSYADINAVVDKSQVPMSRHGRSEPDLEPEDDNEEIPRGAKGSHGKAKSSRNSSSKAGGNGKQKKGSKGSSTSKGSDLNKYNEYMDSVFRRMNAMIKTKKMDPLRVNLYAGPSKGGNQKQKKNGDKSEKKNKKNGHSARMDLGSEEEADDAEDHEELDEEESDENGPARRDIFLNISHHSSEEDHESVRKIRALLESVENGTVAIPNAGSEDDSPRGSESNSKPKKPKGSSSNRNPDGKPKEKNQSGNSNKNNKNKKGQKENNNKNKNKKVQNTRPTRGVLHGLSTLKRDGNVAVIKQGDKARIVRASFLLGPVSLEIMPRKSKSGGESEKSGATATASKLKGVLEVRLKKGSATKIRRLRVYPPKNVKVDGASSSLATASGKGNKNKKPQQYGKVTPMATARLRQIASTVVRQNDKTLKSP